MFVRNIIFFIFFIFFTFQYFVQCNAQVLRICQFHLSGDNKLFEKTPENLPVGGQIAEVQVHPRTFFAIESTDDREDIEYVKFAEVDDRHIALIVAKSLEDLVDQAQPKSVLKFKLACRGSNDTEIVYLPVNIYVQDINDHSPIFQNAPYFIEVDELTPVGLTIFKGIRATDGDKPNTANSELSYSIVGGNVGDTFILSDPMEGAVVVAKPLDYDEGVREYKLDIQVQDHGSPVSHSSVTTLTIKVKDSDDQNPAFTSDVYKVKVEEKWQLTGAAIREKLAVEPSIRAQDTDKGINASVGYSILAGNEAAYFSLDPSDGVLYLLKEIDREQLLDNLFILQIQAAQRDNPIRLTKARLEIEIIDLNDNLPIFEVDLYNVSIMENLPNGFSVAQVRAIDEDQGENGAFRFQLEDPVDAFQIDQVSGWITVKNQTRLDGEKYSRLDLKVFAIEKTRSVLGIGEPSSTQVEVHLIDTNDNDPVFLPSTVYRFNVSETAPPGTVIGSVRAVDADRGDNGRIFYFKHPDSSGSPFDIDRENGSVFVSQSPAALSSKAGEFTLFVGAGDKPGEPSERRTSLAIVYIQTEDENNNAPTFLGMPLSAQVGENLPAGTVVTTVMAKDPDSNSLLRFSLDNKNGTIPFQIESRSGVVTTSAPLDFETVEEYGVDISVTDGDFIVAASLIVRVIDVNDHIPKFERTLYKFSVVEEEEPGLIIGSVTATDVEKGVNGQIFYDLLNSTVFGVTENGTVYTVRPIDREKESSFDITVVASDRGIPSLSGSATIHVDVEDINDNLPQFAARLLTASVKEETDPPVELARISATDADAGANAQVLYYIVSGNEDGEFHINRTTGVISAQRALDFEKRSRHVLNVSAVDREEHEGNPTTDWTKSFAQVVVNVEDRHDSPPNFERGEYIFVIAENHKPFEIAAVVNAYNTSSPYEQKLVYWMNESKVLKLDGDSGEIILIEPIDRDAPSNQVSFKVQVFARDLLSISKQNGSTNVTILVSDVNDNSPKFEQNFYQVQIPEDTPLGSTLPVTFITEDPDEGPNGLVAVFQFNQSHPKFVMNNATGVVTLVEPLDYEEENRFTFQVEAVDRGDIPRTGSTTLVVNVLNINESPPVFTNSSYELWAGENVGRGTQVGQVSATDADANSVLYSLVRGDLDFFDIDESSGKVYTKADTGGRSLYHLVAMAIDDGQPKPLSSTAEVTVHVKEANNHPPVFTQPVYEASVAEKDSTNRVVAKVSARDEDPLNNQVTYSIAEGNEDDVFVIEPQTGEIRVNPEHVQRLDFDVKSAFTLVVEAKDSHERPRVGVAMVQITVDDVNDHPPKFTQNAYHSAVRENLADAFCFLQVKADSGDSVDRVRYSLVGAAHAFAVDGASGQVCAVKSLDRETQAQYTLTVKATDDKFNSFATVNVEVVDENDNAPEFELDRYEVTVPRDAKPGSRVVVVRARDPDTLHNGQVTYWTTNNYGLFEMDYKSGAIKLLRGFAADADATGDRIYVLELFAQDHGMDPKTGRAELMVKVSADGGHKPVFDKFVYFVTLPEREDNLTVVTVTATDPDPGDRDRVRYRIRREIDARGPVDDDEEDAFRVDPLTGQLILHSPLDFTRSRFHQVEVEAFDDGEELTASSTIVQVKVINVNDHAPHFYPIPSVVRVPASTAVGQSVFKVQAVDEDDPDGSSTRILYQSTTGADFFRLDPTTGDVVVAQRLVPIVQNMSVVASDQAVPPLENEINLVLHVYDDDSPQMRAHPVFATNQIFRQYNEVLVPGTPIARVQAKIADESDVSYNITDGIGFRSFGIDSETGIVYTKKTVERGLYHLLVSAYNKAVTTAFGESVVTIKSVAPSIQCPVFIFAEFRASVSEAASVGAVVMNDLQVKEPEQFAQLEYKIGADPSNGAFGVRVRSDNTAQVVLRDELDRELMDVKQQGIFKLTVSASNEEGCETNATLRVFVEDVNDNAPTFALDEYVTTVKENSAAGTSVLRLSAVDVDDVDSGRLVYSIVEGNEEEYFSLDKTSGRLAVLKPCDREATAAFDLVVAVNDTANHTNRVVVFVEVLDKNDEKPKFGNDSYILVTKEGELTFPNQLMTDLTYGTASLEASLVLEATDLDVGENSRLDYSIVKGNEDGEFAMTTSANKGVLSVVRELDRDAYETDAAAIRFLVVSVRDGGSPALSSTAMVTVVVEDVNDQPPEFVRDHYHQLVSEGVNIGYNVTRVEATDKDSAENTHLAYGMRSDDPHERLPFEMDPETGVVTVSKLLDFAEKNEYNITLFVSDGVYATTSNLKVYVAEAIDRQPRTGDRSHFDFRVEENKAGERVGQVLIGRSRDNLRRPIDYKILSADAEDYFAISSVKLINSDGTIFTKVGLDREKRETYSFVVMQEDQKLAGRKRPDYKNLFKISDVCQVNIIVEDANDEAPKFALSSYVGSIDENCDAGTPVNITPAIGAVDADSGLNSVFRYSLDGVGAQLFRIDPLEAHVFFLGDTNKTLDREETSEYHLQVTATDVFNLSTSTELKIVVSDVNDHGPVFTHGDQSLEILETTPVGTRVTKVVATDEDAPGPNSSVLYSLASPFGQFFRVDANTGEIFLNGIVSPETIFALNVSAADGGGRIAFASVHVHVLDVNNHAPVFTRPDFRFRVPEGRYTLHPHTLVTLEARDDDHGTNAAIEYRLDSVSDEGWPFVVDANSGQLNITRDLDRETHGSYSFVVMALDRGSPRLSSTTAISVDVLDVNDEQPRFIGDPYYASVAENQRPGYFVAQVRAYDLDSNATGNGRVFYKLDDNVKRTFFIDSKEGTIWTLASLDYETESSYRIQVTAYDRGTPPLSATATVFVNVTDKDDLLPNFRKSVFMVEVAENAPPGSVVYKLDAGSPKFHYSVIDEELDETFSLDETTGQVSLLRHLDSERQSRYRMRVLASDPAQSGHNDSARVILLVSTGPALRTFPKRNYRISVRENLPAPLPILDLNATDETETNPMHYSILGNDFAGLFNLDGVNGRLTLTKSLDREVKDSYVIKVRGRKLGMQSTKQFMGR
uniref:Cadherin domain-containing protein n=1 Tax=Strigamia maritima TaxID=126957 RepID=T1IXK6_STRMM